MQQVCFPFLPFGCSHFYQDGYNSRSQKQAAQGHGICYTFPPLMETGPGNKARPPPPFNQVPL